MPGASTPTGGSAGSVGALYLHVPFCLRRCAYCDFASSAVGEGSGERLDAYVEVLSRLVAEAASLGLLDGLRTAYVGGGTPTILGGRLPRLLASVSGASSTELEELTFEANPDSSSRGLFDACREVGATRVSIGVQSTDDAVLRSLGRIHDADRALSAIRWAGEAGLRVSADLMAGVPGQSAGDLSRDVERLASAGVGHVSVYALEVHGGTPFGRLEEQRLLDIPDEDETADLLEEAEGALVGAGFERYEVSNYARPGERSRHNLAYWTGVPYLGLGTAAASMLDVAAYGTLRAAVPDLPAFPEEVVRVRLGCRSSIDDLLAARSLADLAFEVESLSERQAIAEDLMLRARLTAGLDPDLLDRARRAFGSELEETLERMVELGLMERSPAGDDAAPSILRPTRRGWLLGNELYGALWDLAAS